MLIQKKYIKHHFHSAIPLTFPALLTSNNQHFSLKIINQKKIWILQKKLALHDKTCISLNLSATASLHDMLFAYVFTTHGHFAVEKCNHYLSQLSANLLLGPKRCKRCLKWPLASPFLTCVNCFVQTKHQRNTILLVIQAFIERLSSQSSGDEMELVL